jgi:hypothetical protein
MALREGWLQKEGGSFKTWKKRWFVLEADEFAYYNKKGGTCLPSPHPPLAPPSPQYRSCALFRSPLPLAIVVWRWSDAAPPLAP